MMSEVLSYLIMITCILIWVSSKEVKWTVRDTSPILGQDLTLFCKVDNCTVHETKRWHGGPDKKPLMSNSGLSTDKTKYSTSIEKNGFILNILNLTVKDLNISYECSCGLDFDNHILYIEDVYTADNLNKKTNGTNYIGTNDVGGIPLYVYIAIPVILVILLIIVIVKRHWLWGRLKEKMYGTGRRNTARESFEPSLSWKDSERVDNPNVTVPLLDSNPGQSSGNMNQVPPGIYSQPSSSSFKLVEDILRPRSEKMSLTNKLEIITSEMENHSSSSKGDNSNDNSVFQQAIEMLEDQNRKLDVELEFYKSYQTDKMKKQKEKLQCDNDMIQKKIDDLNRTNHPTSDLFQEQQQLQDDLVKLNSEITIFDKKNSELHKLQARHREEVSELKKKTQCLSQEVEDIQTESSPMQAKSPETTKAINEFNELVKKYHTEMDLRKKYHNELVELKGKIRVFCRVRPKIKEDGDGQMANNVVDYDQDSDGLIYVSNKTHKFEVDKVFKEGSLQKEVFDEVKALVTSCIDGNNVCIFAYGQTGSGKTFSMQGSASNPGINPKALEELLNEASAKGDAWSFTITVSFIEIYNEVIRDLLINNQSNKKKVKCVPGPPPVVVKLEVKKNPDGGLYVPGLSLVDVKTIEDVNEIFTIGERNRATATTDMNEHSSRSHALLCVTVTGFNKITDTKTTGKLNLVDLAGSESVSKSGAVGDRLTEAKHINTSLLCLRNTLHALISKQDHVPYRNSKLTYLLGDSLGGDSKALMIVQVAPVQKHMEETISSLTFSKHVRTIELGQASKKIKSGDVKTVKT